MNACGLCFATIENLICAGLCQLIDRNNAGHPMARRCRPGPSRQIYLCCDIVGAAARGREAARGGGAAVRGVPNGEMETVHCAYLSRRYFVKGQKRFCFLGVFPTNIRE